MPDRRTPEEREHVAGKLNPDGKPAAVTPGSIVEHDGERRVVVDVAEDHEGLLAVLRYPDDDERREVDGEGGDVHLTAEPTDSLTVVGHIDD